MAMHRWSTCWSSRHKATVRLRIATGIQVVSAEVHRNDGRSRQSLPNRVASREAEFVLAMHDHQKNNASASLQGRSAAAWQLEKLEQKSKG